MIDWSLAWGYIEPYLTGAAIVSGVFFWIKFLVAEIVKLKCAKKIEEYKYRVEVTKKAEIVARVLAHWLAKPEDKEELNRLTFECYLWLPDDIARDLADLLAYERVDEVTVRTVLIKIRKHLNMGVKEYQTLTNENLTSFKND